MKKLLFIILLISGITVSYFLLKSDSASFLTVKDFVSCEAAGFPIMESYPRQCRTPEGTTYTEEIKIVQPKPDEIIQVTTSTPTTTISTSSKPQKACIKTGCSGQICSDKDIVSTCEYREEYACYSKAVCERQQNGECGWTETLELTSCITKSRNEDNPL